MCTEIHNIKCFFYLGFVMVGIAFLGFNKLGKEHRKVSKDDFLLEHEKPIQLL